MGNMTIPILATKTYVPPLRSARVTRPRLIERLDAGLQHKLTLISAPAGFGKTTLLSEWIANCRSQIAKSANQQISKSANLRSPFSDLHSPFAMRHSQFAWLSLDPDDNEPAHFWRYVIAALQTVDATLGETTLVALQSPQPPSLDALVATLINDVATLPTPLVLILDDYHLIGSDAIHVSVNFLLDHVPPQLRLVIATREDPPLALPRRRARMELTEIRAADLRFTTDEATTFLNATLDLGLPAEDVAALQDRTEGWIAGLQMAALSMQTQATSDKHGFVATFASDDRYIFDYLVEEVFQRQPPHVQTFLLQTSILERLCGPLCDAVVGISESANQRISKPANQQIGVSLTRSFADSQEVLEYLERANLFTIPLDNRRQWYRYHHLFADLLRQRLTRSVGAQGLTPLYLRASAWHEREGFVPAAVSLALAATDTEYAADLIERHVLDVFYHSEIALVYHWLKSLPENLIRARPLLCAVYANSIVLALLPHPEAIELAERWLQEAESALATGSPAYNTTVGFIAEFRAYLSRFRGDPPQTVIDLSLKALALLPEDETRFRSALANNLGMAYWALGDEEAASHAFIQARQIGEKTGDWFNAAGAAYFQAQMACQRGRLREAAAICRAALQSFGGPAGRKGRPIPYAGTIYVALGRVLLEWNELEEAQQLLEVGLELVKLTTPTEQTTAYISLAHLKHVQRQSTQALDLLDQATGDTRTKPYIAAQRVRIWLALSETDPCYLAAAVQWAQERQLTLDGGNQYDPEQLALARLLIARHRASPPARGQTGLRPILQFLDRQLHLAKEKKRSGWTIETSILQALALRAQGNTHQAVATLQRALALAEPEGYVRTFVDEGAPMAHLLYQAAERGISPAYVGKLLAAFEATEEQRSKGAGEKGLTTAPLHLRPPALIEPLSEREIEVLRLVAEGLSNRQVAQQLFLSPNTVRIHTSNIYGKLGVNSRTQAVARARTLGIL